MKIVEYYVRQVISDGIARLRARPDEIDDIFAELLCPPLNIIFGKKVLDEIKCFFVNNDIPVRSAFSQNAIDLPSITVQLISSQEDPQYRAMQDHIWYDRVPKEPSVIQGVFSGVSYDPYSGRLYLPKTMDLSEFIQGRKLFSAEDDTVYTINGPMSVNELDTPSYDLKDQYVTVTTEDGDTPSGVRVAKLYLLSSIDFSLKRLAGSWFREVFEIRMNAATNSDQAIWLYYLTSHILLKNKGSFEEVGLESQTYGATDFSRDTQKMPNSMWGRTIRMTFLVQHTWSEEVDALELYGVNVNVQSSVTGIITNVEADYGS